MLNKVKVKVYNGYGNKNNLVVYGHVFKFKSKVKQKFRNGFFANFIQVIRLFILKPFPFVRVQLIFEDQIIETKTAYDGFFKLEWASSVETLPAGWYNVVVNVVNDIGEILSSGGGKIYVPHITQYVFISDIDDTVMVSHSKAVGKRLKELLFKNPRTRKTFSSTRKHYQLLAAAKTNAEQPNPFFYVSSSEWNLYDYLVETFRYQRFPEGTFLLNQLKRWKDLLKSGKTGHEGKFTRIMRIIEAFPHQKFILLGDNSQQDPIIYGKIALLVPSRVLAVYIRNVRPSKVNSTKEIMLNLERVNVSTCIFEHSNDAILHSRAIGLIK